MLFSQSVGLFFALWWITKNIPMKILIHEFLCFVVDLFFREVSSRGAHKLPPRGQPGILCIAPHANQFLDPLVTCLACSQQPNSSYGSYEEMSNSGSSSSSSTISGSKFNIGFVVAAVTMRRKYVGRIARWIDGIPVERP